jgi:hypothetical protein
MEGKDDVLFGDSELDELVGDADFGAVMLNPDFALFDVEMEDAAKLTVIVAPADVEQLVVVMLGIKNGLDFVFFVVTILVGGSLGAFRQKLTNVLPILFYSHWAIASCATCLQFSSEGPVLKAIEEFVHCSKGLAMVGLEGFYGLDAIGELLLEGEGWNFN